MGIGANQTLRTTDFENSPSGAADKIVVTNASGEINNLFIGALTADADQSQTTRNAGTAVGEANATTKKNRLTQGFIPTAKRIRGVELYKDADTGTFTGTVTIEIYANSGGSPTGSALAAVTIPNATWLLIPAGAFQAAFAAEYASLVPGSLYHIQIKTSTSDNSNHPNFGHNTAGGYGSGAVKYWNTTDGFVSISTIDLYFKTLFGTSAAIPKSDSTGRAPTTTLPYSLLDIDTTDSTSGIAYKKVLPANFFTANSGIKLKGNYDVSWNINTGPSSSVTIKLNGTQVATVTLTPNPPGGSNTARTQSGTWEAWILNTSLTAQKGVMAFSSLDTGLNDNSTTGFPICRAGTNEVTSAVDTAGVNVLTVEYGGSWTHYNIIAEKIG